MKTRERNSSEALKIREGGMGNTPLDGVVPAFSHNFETAYTFDYFTFSFPFPFQKPLAGVQPTDPGLTDFYSLLTALHLKYDLIEESCKTKGFRYGYSWSVPVKYVGMKHPATRFDYYLEPNKKELGCFELSGACCRDFERRYSEQHCTDELDFAWYNLFSTVIDCSGNPTRLDVAFDIFNADPDHRFMYYMDKLIHSEFNSPIGIVHPDYIFDDRLNTFTKQVVTLGGEKSKVKICIYNKKLEQEAQNLICVYDSWIRIEIRFYNKKAQEIVAGLVSDWENRYEYLVGVLKNYLQLKNRPNQSQSAWISRKVRTKWQPDSYWQSLFMDTDKKKIANLFQKTTSIDAQRAYLMENYNRFLTMLSLAMDPKEMNLYKAHLISKGFENLKPGDLEKINYFRSRNNLRELSEDELLDRLTDVEIDKAKAMEDPSAIKALEHLEVEKADRLKVVFSKYKKNKNKNLFFREFMHAVGDDFDEMTDEELREQFEALLMLLR